MPGVLVQEVEQHPPQGGGRGYTADLHGLVDAVVERGEATPAAG